MVLVNDFGELPIDADLIESQDGDTLNLANGCACCSMGGDLFNALVDALNRSPRPDHLLIEASGVADPVRIANIALAEPDLSLDSTVSIIDAENIGDLVNDNQIGETVTHQLVSSDLILVNKLDLIDPLQKPGLIKLLDDLAPNAQKIETEYSQIPVDVVIGSHKREVIMGQEDLLAVDHSEPYIKWSKTFENRLDRAQFEKVLDDLGNRLLRLKGIVYFSDNDLPFVVQYVASRWTITRTETIRKYDRNLSRIVAIGLKNVIGSSELDALFLKYY